MTRSSCKLTQSGLPKLVALSLTGILAACSSNSLERAPPSPDRPWVSREAGKADGTGASSVTPRSGQAKGSHDFGIPSDPALASISRDMTVATDRPYGLAELIDLAQRSNPSTRISWEKARQAALAVGMAEATYLPLITAHAIGGAQRRTSPLPGSSGGPGSFDSTLKGASASIAMQWLIFDFGHRRAVSDAAEQVSLAANIVFNGTHQKVVFDVTRAYYQYGAALEASRIAQQTLQNSIAIRNAAEDSLKNGRGTAVEVAQARQKAIQSELRKIKADGEARNAYQTLLSAMGVTATLKIKVHDAGGRRLPAGISQSNDAMIRRALANRPDVAASYAALKASKSGIAAAKAEFFPKIFVSGAVAAGTVGFDADGLPGISDQSTSAGVLVGISVPLYDGGLRTAQLKRAESVAATAEEGFRQTQIDAATEIVVASNTLRTALESFKAATHLTAAAKITYDGTLDAYKNGLGTVTAANQADSDLLDARLAQADARAASFISAANLAFVMGAITSGDGPAGH